MEKRGALFSSVAAVLSALLLSFVLHDPNSVPNIYSDVVSFWGRCWVQNGVPPYLNSSTCFATAGTSPFNNGTAFEYPPLSGWLTYLARVVGGYFAANFPDAGGGQSGYYDAFGVMSLIAAVVLAWSCWKIAKKLGRRLNPLYFFLPSVVIYGIYNFDLFHALFVMLSLQALLYGRKSASAASLGLAISTKLVSAVLIPVFLIEIRDKRDALKFLTLVIGVVAFFNVPLMVANYQNWLQTYTYLRSWGLEDAWFGWIFQSPATWGYAKIFGFTLMGALLLRVYTLKTDVTIKTFLALTAYLLGTYIYAPQFNLMLIPLVAVMAVDHPSVYLWDTFNALIILTWFIGFPSPNWSPTMPWTLPQEFALLRDVMLVWMAAWVLRAQGWNLRSLLPHRRQKTLDSALPRAR
jgi:hypothetical protein